MTQEKKLSPGLYLVATPIGHLGDMTLRAIDVLGTVDLILCEDTRVTRTLLTHYNIHTPTRVYNAQSDVGRETGVLDQIRAGARVALVSDAGMPLISDPGYPLVVACRQAGIYVTSVPGANAVLTALQLSGLPTDAFMFIGFLPTKTGERQRKLASWAGAPGTLITYERADRVAATLRDIQSILGNRPAAIVREMTKMFEEVLTGPISDLLKTLENKELKGEVVILVDRQEKVEVTAKVIQDHLKQAYAHGMSKSAAATHVAKVLQISRRQVYEQTIV